MRCRATLRVVGNLVEEYHDLEMMKSTTWHALLRLIRIATHPHAHCYEFVPHWHTKLRAITAMA